MTFLETSFSLEPSYERKPLKSPEWWVAPASLACVSLLKSLSLMWEELASLSEDYLDMKTFNVPISSVIDVRSGSGPFVCFFCFFVGFGGFGFARDV